MLTMYMTLKAGVTKTTAHAKFDCTCTRHMTC